MVPPDLLLCGFKQTPTVVTCRLHAAPTDRMFLCWVWTWKCYSAGCSYGIHTNARSLGCRCSSLLLFRIVFVIKFACILAPRNPYVKKEIASKCTNLQDGKQETSNLLKITRSTAHNEFFTGSCFKNTLDNEKNRCYHSRVQSKGVMLQNTLRSFLFFQGGTSHE